MGAECVIVIALVGDHADEGEALDQRAGLGGLVHLSGGENHPQGMTERIDRDVDLGAQAAARPADGLISSPPFAPAACWCARTMVASIMTCSKFGSSAKSLKRLAH